MKVTASQLEQHRVALTGHCYRMLGSAVDADDAVQETMVRAWRSLEQFDGRASLKTWLVRIATNVALDAIAARGRRARPMEDGPSGTIDDALVERPRAHWLEPVPDAKVIPTDTDPEEQLALRQSIRLAFVSALQYLPAKQRASLLLADVLGWSAAEIADVLDTTVPAVNSALQRARATLDERDARRGRPLDAKQRELLDRYVDAFERYDVGALTSMLRDDAVMSMPPYTLWLQGAATIAAWLEGRGSHCRGSRLVPTEACGAPAWGQYHALPGGGFAPWGLVVLELDGDRIARWNTFLDTTAFPRFGLPDRLDA
jgi:RNA polymerase sigma-70 factor (ECF subfamily)